ncbi:MAG: tetratricopeptide repeat protein [Candidatus Omnitrophica bacterium]|nr:tetratricopeptide repeat protein [Candidatus Omnitrophota bacterium]
MAHTRRCLVIFVTLLFFISTLFLRDQSLIAQPADKGNGKTAEKTLLESEGAKKFKAKDYRGALEEFKKLEKEHPNSPIILRYIGMTLNAMNEPDEAVTYFKKALELSPRDPAARYHLAQSYQQMNQNDAARTELLYLRGYPELAGYYKDKAERALQTLEKGLPEEGIEPQKPPKPWTVYSGFAYEYDDNVSLSSSVSTFALAGGRKAGRYKIFSGISYDVINNAKTRAGITYFFRQNLHDNDMSNYNFRLHELSPYAYYNTELFARPAQLAMRYTFAHGTLNHRTFSSLNGIYPSLNVKVIDNVVYRLYDNLEWKNFRNKGFEPGVSSRTGFYNTVGNSLTLFANVLERQCYFTNAYEFRSAGTRGKNFDDRENVFRWLVHVPVIEKIVSDTIFEYRETNYCNFIEEPKRRDRTYYFGFRISRPILKYFTLSGYYAYTDNRSDNDYIRGQFIYDRHVGGVELSFAY